MSDFRAIAAMTLTLRNLLSDALTRANDIIPGAKVETRRPDRREPTDVDRGVINVYLYQTTPNPAWRNADQPERRADGTLIHRPTLALDLHFLLSFYGDEENLVPQLLLGLASTALYSVPYPPARFLPRKRQGDDALLRDPLEEKLAGTGLLDQIEILRFAPLQMSHDELSRLWTIFFQIPYTLSTAYLCSVVLLQPDLRPEPPLPVRRPASVHFSMSHQLPQIEAVKPQVIDYQPAQTVILEGRNLSPTGLEVRIGAETAPIVRASANAAAVQLPAQVKAGIQAVAASRDLLIGDPPVRRRLFGASTASLVVRPVIQPLLYQPAATPEPALVEVGVAPAVAAGQPVSLLLNEKSPPEGRAPRAYSLASEAPAVGGQLKFRASGVEPGSYLTRLEVAGVASSLWVDDEDPASPDYGSYTGPTLDVPSPDPTTP